MLKVQRVSSVWDIPFILLQDGSISNESFLEGLKWISDLKIRGSWGKMGNQFSLSPQNAVYLFGESIGASYYDLYGTFNSSVRGYYPLRIGNPDATWETNTTTDIGFDAGLFNSKVTIVFDWYSKKASDLLYNPEMPGTAGVADCTICQYSFNEEFRHRYGIIIPEQLE